MKLGQNIFTNHIWAEFENGSGLLKNMAARGWAVSLYGYSKTLLTL